MGIFEGGVLDISQHLSNLDVAEQGRAKYLEGILHHRKVASGVQWPSGTDYDTLC